MIGLMFFDQDPLRPWSKEHKKKPCLIPPIGGLKEAEFLKKTKIKDYLKQKFYFLALSTKRSVVTIH
jgi:hypothetical protein